MYTHVRNVAVAAGQVTRVMINKRREFFFGASICVLGVLLGPLPRSYSIPPGDESTPFYIVETLAGSKAKGHEDGPAAEASFNWPTGVAVAADGTVYVADFSNNLIRMITPDGALVETVAGSIEGGYVDGPAEDSLISGPDNISIDEEDNIYIADANNFLVRKLSMGGVVSTIAGDNVSGFTDGKPEKARFGYPTGIAYDGSEKKLYIADRRNHSVRMIELGSGRVSTIAGNGVPGKADGWGILSHLKEPISLAASPDGSIYVADSGNHAIRKISKDGSVTTFAGGKGAGYRDGVGADALFFWPTGIAVDKEGNIFVCDSKNNKIRRITPSGVVSTVAGNIISGSIDGLGMKASFNFPTGIAVDDSGRIYVADSGNNLIRKIIYRGKMEASIEARRGDGPML